MSFKHKFSFDEKSKIIIEYQAGVYGFREICRVYSVSQSALKDWIRLVETFRICRLFSIMPMERNVLSSSMKKKLFLKQILTIVIKYSSICFMAVESGEAKP